MPLFLLGKDEVASSNLAISSISSRDVVSMAQGLFCCPNLAAIFSDEPPAVNLLRAKMAANPYKIAVGGDQHCQNEVFLDTKYKRNTNSHHFRCLQHEIRTIFYVPPFSGFSLGVTQETGDHVKWHPVLAPDGGACISEVVSGIVFKAQ